MATSMVKGNPVKLMLSFAFPLLIGNLLQQTYNIIDAAIVGQALGPDIFFWYILHCSSNKIFSIKRYIFY